MTDQVDDPLDDPSRPASRRGAIIRAVAVATYLIVVFVFLLPSVVDYGAMVEAFQAAPPAGLALVALIGISGWVFEGAAVAALLPGLGITHGVTQFLSVTAVGNTIPGPLDWMLGYKMFRAWNIPASLAALGLALNSLLTTVGKLLMPAIAIFFLTLNGRIPTWGFLVVALIMIPVTIGSLIGIWVLRSEAFARRVGAYATRATDSVMRRIHRAEPGDLTPRILDFRASARVLLRQRLGPTVLTQISTRAVWLVCLLASLRVVGVPAEVLPFDIILGVYAAVLAITVLPIAPGGAGVPELLYIWAFTSIVDTTAYDDAIAAGVMLMRAFQWFIPIPVGYVVLLLFRRSEARAGRTLMGGAISRPKSAGGA
jgi:uncharacterized membrane protein YbhN (UPF0104 family)